VVERAGMEPLPLDHEKLDVYRASLEFVGLSLRILKRIPIVRRELRVQMERATMSVPLNIAEGCGKTTTPERARFYAIARGSALECGALVDLAALMNYAAPDEVTDAKLLICRIVSMLSKMCR